MASVTSATATDKAADLLENLSLDSRTKTSGNPAPAKKDIYCDNGTFIYNQGYGYAPFGTYSSPNSPIPTMGYDGQLYGAQHYQYPGSFYQQSASTSTLYTPYQSSHSQGGRGSGEKLPLSVGTTARNPNNRVHAGTVNRSNGPASDAGFSSSQNTRPTRPTSALGQAPGFMNLMYPTNRMYSQYGNSAYGQYGNSMYGQYGNRGGADFGSFPYNSWTNGRGWVVVDNKYKLRGHGYGNENKDGLNELNRGPRAKSFKSPKEFGAVSQTVEGQNLLLADCNEEENMLQIPDKEQYNQEDFPEDYTDAKFFVIKSFSEDDVHKSIKYGVWTSTSNGNKKLDAAYQQAKENPGSCPVFLFFSVNTSGQFVGLAEMVGPVDFNKTVEYWQQDKWTGCFPLKWHIIKDVPNSFLRHITLENNENKPVTNSRDTQAVLFEKGIQVLKIFKAYKGKTSILDDFGFYTARERIMQEKRARQNIQKQILDGKPAAMLEKDGIQTDAALIKEPVGTAAVELVKTMNGEVKVKEDNGSDAVVESSCNDAESAASSENKVVSNVVASAC